MVFDVHPGRRFALARAILGRDFVAQRQYHILADLKAKDLQLSSEGAACDSPGRSERQRAEAWVK